VAGCGAGSKRGSLMSVCQSKPYNKLHHKLAFYLFLSSTIVVSGT